MKIYTRFTLSIVILFMVLPFCSVAQWEQYGQDINGDATYEYYGRAMTLSADGKILAIGSQANPENLFKSIVRVYQYTNNGWEQIGSDILADSGDNSDDIALNKVGNIIAIGSIRDGVVNGQANPDGHIKTYTFDGADWISMADDIKGTGGENTGSALSLSEDGLTMVVGAHFNDENGMDSGQLRAYRFNNGSWTQVGTSINGDAEFDNFGITVDINANGSIICVGAPSNDSNAGQVKIYQEVNGDWQQMGSDILGDVDDVFGRSVSLNGEGDFVAVGSIQATFAGIGKGYASVFQFVNDEWVQVGQKIIGEVNNTLFGLEVSLNSDASIVAIGATRNNSNGLLDAGFVQIYKYMSESWTQVDNNIVGVNAEDNCGNQVSLNADGNIVAVASFVNDANGFQAGQVRVFRNSDLVEVANLPDSNIEIFPNPASHVVFIKNNDKTAIQNIRLINMLGQQVMRKNISDGSNVELNVSKLSQGIYFIEIEMEHSWGSQKIEVIR